MTIYGVILTLVGIYILFNCFTNIKKGYVLSIFFSTINVCFFGLGNICKIGSFVVYSQYLFAVISFITAFIFILTKKINKKAIIYLSAYFICLLIGILFSFFRTYKGVGFDDSWDYYIINDISLPLVKFDNYSFLVFVRAILFALEILPFGVDKNLFVSLLKLYKKHLNKFVVLIFTAYFIEFIVVNYGNATNYRDIITTIFGSDDATYHTYRYAMGFAIPLIFCQEYSVVVFVMFNCELWLTYCFVTTKSNKKRIAYCILYIYFLINMIIQTSMSSLLYLGSLLLIDIYLLYKRWPQSLFISLLLAIVAIIVLANNFSTRIENIFSIITTNDIVMHNSEGVRFAAIKNCLSYFVQFPLFGTGIGVLYSFSAIVTCLCDIGLISSFAYIKYLQCTFHISKSKWFILLNLAIIYLFNGHMSALLYSDSLIFLIFMFSMIYYSYKPNYKILNYCISTNVKGAIQC